MIYKKVVIGFVFIVVLLSGVVAQASSIHDVSRDGTVAEMVVLYRLIEDEAITFQLWLTRTVEVSGELNYEISFQAMRAVPEDYLELSVNGTLVHLQYTDVIGQSAFMQSLRRGGRTRTLTTTNPNVIAVLFTPRARISVRISPDRVVTLTPTAIRNLASFKQRYLH